MHTQNFRRLSPFGIAPFIKANKAGKKAIIEFMGDNQQHVE